MIECPECGETMYADEEWQILDRSKVGEQVGESIQGDYAHAHCLDSDSGRSGGDTQ